MCSKRTGFKCNLSIKKPLFPSLKKHKVMCSVHAYLGFCVHCSAEKACHGFIIGLCFSDSLFSSSCKEAEILTELGDFSAESQRCES